MHTTRHEASPKAALEVIFLQMTKLNGASSRPETYFFSNGRQQCSLKIEVLLVDGVTPVKLAEVGATVRLVAYAGGGALGQGTYAAWRPSTAKLGYNWNEHYVQSYSNFAAPSDAPEQDASSAQPRDDGTEIVNLYVSTASPAILKIAVEVLDEAGNRLAISNWSDAPETGTGDGNGKFNSSLELNAVAFRQPPPNEYGGKVTGEMYRLEDHLQVGKEGKGTRSYIHYISLTRGGIEVQWRSALRSYDRSEGVSIWTSYGETSNGTEWSITYLIQPGGQVPKFGPGRVWWVVDIRAREPEYIWHLDQLRAEYAPMLPGHDTSRVAIGQIMGNVDYTFCNEPERELVDGHKSEFFVLTDEFGCYHYMRLYFTAEFNWICVANYTGRLADAWDNDDALRVDMRVVADDTHITADGHAQARVTFTVNTKFGNVDSQLSDDELASIRMIDYDTNEPIPYGDLAWNRAFSGWTVADTAGPYYIAADAEARRIIKRGAGGNSVTRYVSADQRATAPLKCAFSIQMRDGTVYRTNGLCSWPDMRRPTYEAIFDDGGRATVSPRMPSRGREAAPHALTIDRLGLKVTQSKLFANGRQQVRAEITVEAKIDGKYVDLTAEELASIRLMDYDSKKDVPMVSEGGEPSTSGWASQTTYHGYAYHPESGALPDAPGQTVFLYLSANMSEDFLPLKLAFSITTREQVIYMSTGFIIRPGAPAQEYDPSFNVPGVAVTPVQPATYIDTDFRLSDRRAIAGQAKAGVFHDAMTLSLAPGGKILPIREANGMPSGIIHWETRLPADANPCFTGYARPGETSIQWDPVIQKAAAPLPDLPRAEAGSVVVALCGRINLPASSVPGAPRGPLVVDLMDDYGSSHRVVLAFKEGTRDELYIV